MPESDWIHSMASGVARLNAIVNLLRDENFCSTVDPVELDRDFREALDLLRREWQDLVIPEK